MSGRKRKFFFASPFPVERLAGPGSLIVAEHPTVETEPIMFDAFGTAALAFLQAAAFGAPR